jgi:hypothetical protein
VGGGTAEWVSAGVGIGVGDVEGLGDVELVADGTALCVGVEVAALPHPAASESTSKSTANLMSSPKVLPDEGTVRLRGHAWVQAE